LIGIHCKIVSNNNMSNLHNQIAKDLQLFENHETLLEKKKIEIIKFLEQENIELQENIVEKTLAVYATSQSYYAPIVFLWSKYLLKKAKKENRCLMFLARDGIPPYLISLKFKNKFQDYYKELNTHLLYFSRNVLQNSAPPLIIDYMKQEKITPNYLIVDIGYAGSCTPKIKELIHKMEKSPQKIVNIKYNFLLSFNSRIKGFLNSKEYRLPFFYAPSYEERKFTIKWLENTHHGLLPEAHILVKLPNGEIVPDSFINKKNYRKDKKSLEEYCLRHFGLKAISDFFDETDCLNGYPIPTQKLRNFDPSFQLGTVDMKRLKITFYEYCNSCVREKRIPYI